jgi:hypothetical protein
MHRCVVLALVVFMTTAQAQEPARAPTPDEQAFARLPQDVQGLLSGLSAREARAGATSFPPLSPLVPAISFEYR